MNQQVFFENIRSQIIENLNECQSELKIAVAWFTDKRIIKKVNELIDNNVEVEIIIYDDHVNKKDLFKSLYYNRAKIFLSKKLMHNKFCVIDNRTVINGSYNWTLNASTNEENIQITYDNYDFADKFIVQFDKLKKNCKPIDDFFEYSLESLENIDWEFRDYLYQKRQTEFPYFYSLQNLELSESNKFFKSLKIGVYLIQNEEEEEEFLRTKYFVESKHSLNKINKVLNKKISLPQFYDFVPSIKSERNGVFPFNQDTYRVETWNSYKYVFFIDKANNIIGDKVQFTDKLPNGLYLQNFSNLGSKKYIVDIKLKKYELDMISIELYNEIGIFGMRKNKRFGDEYKYGLKDFLNKTIVGFKYDYYEIDNDDDKVNFIELPHFRRDTQNNRLIYLDKKTKNFEQNAFKKTIYNYKRKTLSEKPELILPENTVKEDFIFLSDENEKYFSFYVALAYNRHRLSYFKPYELTYSEFENYKSQFARGYIKYKNGYSGQSFLENIDKRLKEKDDRDRINKVGKYKQKEGCYIATMVYGNYNHPEVLELRKFRDITLKKRLIGRKFIKFYYKHSPNYVRYVENKRLLNLFSKLIIKAIVIGIKTWHNNVYSSLRLNS
ncbi:phospholipase D-like domain-containing protein [Bizionia sp.]|uniref:phospholipase D-like domain-containing protein n=1 Tax=Bizionia sp. TaxID=1954480 RepID=UPI003A94EA58